MFAYICTFSSAAYYRERGKIKVSGNSGAKSTRLRNQACPAIVIQPLIVRHRPEKGIFFASRPYGTKDWLEMTSHGILPI